MRVVTTGGLSPAAFMPTPAGSPFSSSGAVVTSHVRGYPGTMATPAPHPQLPTQVGGLPPSQVSPDVTLPSIYFVTAPARTTLRVFHSNPAPVPALSYKATARAVQRPAPQTRRVTPWPRTQLVWPAYGGPGQ